MTEPKRLLEDPPNSLAATLIDVTLEDGPGSARALERTAAALGVSALVGTAVATTTSTATAALAATSATTHVAAATAAPVAASGAAVSATASAATKLGAGIAIKWLAIGSLSTATVVGGAALVVDARSEKPEAASLAAPSKVASPAPNSAFSGATPPSRAALTASDADQPATDVRLQEKANGSTREALRAEATKARANTSATPTGGAAPTSPAVTAAPDDPTRVPSAAFPKVETAPSIADEIALLDRARSELANRNPRATLATLDRLERGGSATLSPEASVVRIEALLQLGEKTRAAALARRFLSAHPDSAHAPRLKEIIAP